MMDQESLPRPPEATIISVIPLKPFGPDRILLRDRGVTSPAQIARAVALAGVFALILSWILPSGPAGAEPAPIAVTANLS